MHGLRYALPLIFVAVLLSLATSIALEAATGSWFERDAAMRGRLAVSAAREALARDLRDGDHDRLRALLTDIARDERVLAAAACSPALRTVAATDDMPGSLLCESAAARADHVVPLPRGRVHVANVAVEDASGTAGTVLLVQDLSYAERRESIVRQILLAAMALLALAALLGTFAAARFSFFRWTREMRRFLRGGAQRPEFAPLLRDVHDLVGRLTSEAAESAGQKEVWNAERLRRVLHTHLSGDTVVVLANREPYIHERAADGSVKVLHPASGLVTALEPVMRACSGTWVAHGAGSADRECADRHGRLKVPPGEEWYSIRRIWLTPEQERGYYYGFSNEGLWPLCHLAHTRPRFRAADWEAYRDVNARFADAVAEEAGRPDPVVLVQDYHFALAPRLLRERLPRATILTFWHVPWPNAERFGICPWREELLDGLLGSSIVGFHIRQHCANFLESVDRYLESRIDRELQAVVQHGRPTLVRPYPISIEWPDRWVMAAPSVAECRRQVFAELGLGPRALLGVGVDRIDYTKGVEERLLAVERLLERRPDLRGRFTFAQLGAPSRTAIPEYRDLNARIEQLAAYVNARFGSGTYRPIALLHAHHEPPQVMRYYRAADLCYVSSLHDGMNLVAKEFVAARDDERGALVLSQFTGAARELAEALVVNPYDVEQASRALEAALGMPEDEQRERMRAMRALVSEFNVYRWAGRMLADAGRLRRRERMLGAILEAAEPVSRAAS